jgi:copper chaperone CopZ
MPTTSTFAVTGMHCASCGILLDETLEELPGVVSSSTHLRRETTTVEYDPAQTSVDLITAEIVSFGYAAGFVGPSS